MRVILDTNVLISAFISNKGASAKILAHCQKGELELLISPDSLTELRRVFLYPSVRKRFVYDDEHIDRFIAVLEQVATVIAPHSVPRVVPDDADDDIFIALALAGEAQYIVTSDKHLLSVGRHQGITILTPAAFYLIWNTLHQE